MKLKKFLAGFLVANVVMTAIPSDFGTASAAELPDPVMQVTFDAANAKDVTGRGNDGTVVGNPEFVQGVSGKAIHLRNSQDVAGLSKQAEQYVNFGTPADLKFGAEDFSLAFWFKTDPHGREGSVISNKNWDSGSNPGFNIGDMNQGLNLNFSTTQGQRTETDRFAQAADGQWHHIAATFDRDGDMIFYIDGQTYPAGNYNNNAAVQNISGQAGKSIDVTNFVLGADGNFKNSVSSVYLDEVSVYKSVLTKEQVKALSDIELPEPQKNTPVLDVSFDNEDASDASESGINGTVIGDVEYVEGVSGKAIHLVNPEGIAGEGAAAKQYVNFGTPENLQFGKDDFTIMFWYMADGNDSQEVAVVSNKNWDSGGNAGFAIGDMRNGMTLNFRANDASGRLDTGRFGGATEKDKWHHIAAVFNRTGNMILYVDGKNADSKSISEQAGKSIDVTDFVLGADGRGRYGVKDSYIDELKVYRSALSQEEISNYNAPYVLRNKIAEYEKLAEESDASKEKIDAFKAALALIKKQAEDVTDLERIEELNALLKRAYNEFTGPDKGIMHFEAISDTHIPGTDNANATNQKLIDVLEDLKRDYPDTSVVLNAGDFSQDGNETQVKGYFNILKEYKDDFEFMTALGNHDVRWKSGWDEIYERYMRYNGEYMGETEGAVYYDKWIDGYHFIILNTEWDIKDRAYISPKQLAWLEETMAENADPSKPIFIALHQAMHDTYYNSNDWGIGMQDHALKEVLRKYPQTIMFTGHIHNGLGAMEVSYTDYGTMVDLPSLKDNDYGDRRGQLGYHVTVYDGKVRLDLRDYLNDEWIPEYSYTIEMKQDAYPAGKVLDVNFDDGTAKDISGYGNDGKLVGNPQFVPDGNGGKALHIVNSDAVATKPEKAEQYADFGDTIRFGEDDFTIMFSYKGETSGDGDGCVIANKNWDTGSNPGFAIGAFAGGNPGMGLNLNTTGSSRADTSRYRAATDGKWHKIAATFDREGSMTLYIDGKAAGSKDISGQAGKSVDVEGLKLVLGADGNYQNAVRDMYIDDLKVYKYSLGAAEIETTWHPYTAEVFEDSVTISWSLSGNESVEPAYLVLDGKKAVNIASGETSKTISGLTPGQEYTILLVNREKAHSNNYRDVYSFVVTPGAEEEAVNKSALESIIAEAEAKELEDYTQESVNTLLKTLGVGREVLNDANSSQGMVDLTVNMIRAALNGLTRKPVQVKPADKTALQEAILFVEEADLSIYTEQSVEILRKALDAAYAVIEDEELGEDDQAIVDRVKDTLIAAFETLVLKETPDVNKDALKKLIDKSVQFDSNKDLYTEESFQVFKKAYDEAVQVYQNEKATQEEVDQARVNLESGRWQLREKPDKDKLEELLAKIAKIDFSLYSKKTAKAVKAAYEMASVVMADETVTQLEIDKAVEQLESAMQILDEESLSGEIISDQEETLSGKVIASNKGDDGNKKETKPTKTAKTVKTGDMANPFALIMLAVMAGAVITAVSVKTKRKNK